MPNKHVLGYGLLIAALVYDGRIHRLNRTKFEALKAAHQQLEEEKNLAAHQVNYLATMMVERDIEPTEFDLFALTHPV